MKRQSTPCRTHIRPTGLFTKLLVRLEETRLWSYGIGGKHAVVRLIKRQSTACYTRIRSHGVFTKSMVLWWQVQPTSKKGRQGKGSKGAKEDEEDAEDEEDEKGEEGEETEEDEENEDRKGGARRGLGSTSAALLH